MKISEEKLAEIKRMRSEGMTIQKIADHYGCSRQNISEILCRAHGKRRATHKNKCIYPGISRWMHENGYSITKMCEEFGMNKGTLGKYMQGTRDIRIRTIREIMRITGLSFEEAFGGVEDGTA